MNNWSFLGQWLCLLLLLLGLGILDSIHSGLNDVRLDGDCDGADLGHTIFWRIFRVFVQYTLLLVRLGPKLLE